MALYPEKYIFDVAGFPKVLAKDLVRDMAAQGLQFGATTHLGEIVTGLRRVEDDHGGHLVLETDGGDYPSRTIVIAAGIGAFEARRLGIAGEDAFEEKGLYFKVLDPKQFEGARVDLAFRLAAGAVGAEFSLPDPVQDGFGQDRACRVARAEKQDVVDLRDNGFLPQHLHVTAWMTDWQSSGAPLQQSHMR